MDGAMSMGVGTGVIGSTMTNNANYFGGGKKSSTPSSDKTQKQFMKQYSSVASENCGKKHIKSRPDTLKCLKGKTSQKLALQKKYPKEFKEFQKKVKLMEKKKKDMLINIKKCSKSHPLRSPAFNKCLNKGTTYANILKEFPLVTKIVDAEGMDKVHEAVDMGKLNALLLPLKKNKTKKIKKGGGKVNRRKKTKKKMSKRSRKSKKMSKRSKRMKRRTLKSFRESLKKSL